MTTKLDFADGVRSASKDKFIARLHEEAPLYYDAGGFWVASRFEDVRALLLDHARLSSNPMGQGFPLLSDDPPRHSLLRGLLSKAFTPARIEAMRPDIEALARELAAAIRPESEVEIVAALTTPLPVAVIAQMMGVPREDAEDFKRWSDAITGLMDDPMGGERLKTVMALRAFFGGLIEKRRAQPGDDLISALVRASESGVNLSDEQVIGFAILLLIAGNETTTNLLGSLLNRLAHRRNDWRRLKADPALIDAAIEEALRTDSPAQFVVRRAKADLAVGDQLIKAGDAVMIYLAAANRDPAKWDDPAAFEIAREKERHVAFGHGVHHCIGAPLARLEAQAVMKALVARFDGVRPGKGAPRRLPSGLLFGFRELPLVFC